MPPTMRRLAVIQFLSWFAMFILFIYATPVVAAYQFGATDPTTQAYNDGADWVGLLFGVYNGVAALWRSEEHTSELQSLMRISYAVFCLKKKKTRNKSKHYNN